jgi:hypothetical protein
MFAIVWILCAYRTFLLSAYLLFYNKFFLIIIVITNRLSSCLQICKQHSIFGVNFTWLIHNKNKRTWWSWYTFKNILRMLDIHVFYFLELWDLFEIQCTCTRFCSVWFPFLFFRELIMTENTTKVIVYTKLETWQEDYM